jgi:hypothetical protein
MLMIWLNTYYDFLRSVALPESIQTQNLMFGTITESRIIKSVGYQPCPSCSGKVSYWETNTFTTVLNFKGKLISTEKYFKCEKCQRRCREDEIIIPKTKVTIQRADGAIVTISEETSVESHTWNRTVDTSKVFPKVSHPLEFATTLAAIMNTTNLLLANPTPIEDKDEYKQLILTFPDFQDDIEKMTYLMSFVDLEEAQKISASKLEQCKKPLRGSDLNFMLKYSIRVINQEQRKIVHIQNFYFKLLDVLEVGDLAQNRYYQSL